MGCSTSCTKQKTDEEDVDDMEDFISVKNSDKCYSVMDGVINIFRQLKRIAENLGLLVDAQEKKGYASALLHFQIAGRSYTNGQTISNIISRVALNYKVTGFGISCLTFPTSAGVYTNDDIIQAKLFDFTTNQQVGNTLTLSPTQLHDKHTDDGNVIGDNFAAGHNIGVKISYSNTDGGAFTMNDIDVFIHVEPIDLMRDD